MALGRPFSLAGAALAIVLWPLSFAAIGACASDVDRAGHLPGEAVKAGEAALSGSAPDRQAVPVPPPPFSEDIYPCSECHEPGDEVDLERRELEDEHDGIVLRHGSRERWCFDCHDPKSRDKLRLASGRLISFDKSYLLCGQCHGPKLRDWRLGIHGKRTGFWNGAKRYLLCVHCHDPHTPRFKALAPEAPPVRPQVVR